MKELLQEMIDAGQGATLPLDMAVFSCNTACCLCGDVAIARNNGDDGCDFSDELDTEAEYIFGSCQVSLSIWDTSANERLAKAINSKLFTPEELTHPHLTTDHSDREIAHDYIRLVMRKVDEVTA